MECKIGRQEKKKKNHNVNQREADKNTDRKNRYSSLCIRQLFYTRRIETIRER